MSNLIITCVKNEGPFLLEWIAFHRSIGFDAFLLFTNDCADGSDTIADALAARGLVTHVRNSDYTKRGPQWTALNSPQVRQALKSAGLALHLDLDEFVNIRAGDGHLDDLRAASGDFDALSLPWRFFGNAGVDGFQDAPVRSQFVRCGPYPVMFPRQALMFKTLFRPSERIDRAGVHAPRLSKGKTLDDVTWLTGSGAPVSAIFDPKRPVLHGPNFGNTLGQINHYALRSKEGFLVKAARGLPNHGTVPIDTGYWVRRNFNDMEDRRLADRTVPDNLMADPELAALHAASCDWHRTEIDRLLGTEQGIDLFSAITVAGNTVVPRDETIAALYRNLGRVFGKAAT